LLGEVPVLDRVVLAPPDGGQPQLLGQHRLLEALAVEARVGLAPVAGPQLGPDPEGRGARHAETLPQSRWVQTNTPPPCRGGNPPAGVGRMASEPEDTERGADVALTWTRREGSRGVAEVAAARGSGGERLEWLLGQVAGRSEE